MALWCIGGPGSDAWWVTIGPSVFDRGGMRYCMNSAALRFIPVDELEAEGYGEYRALFSR